jgi:tRNA U38,U39,U40 pseudouridine synthase TruA
MRIALGIEYDGSRYFGWQRQREVISVQEELEKPSAASPTTPSPSSVPVAPMPGCMPPAR